MKLYTRDEILELDKLLKELLEVLLNLMKENTETYMPGFTHCLLYTSRCDKSGKPWEKNTHGFPLF